MRANLLSGLLLSCAAVLVVWSSAALDLDLESVALLGAALGAVVALVPDRSTASRLAGFGAGFVIAWIGYAARALLLPDSSSGRAVAVFLVVMACATVAAVAQERIPLWSLLLGTAALAGGYELTYAESPSQMLDTSVSAATTLLFTTGVGFLAACIIRPIDGSARGRSAGLRPEPSAGRATARLDEMMEAGR
ncbi:hypothetical protein [Nocardioides cavernaquae]|uniref:hypothetical protein n=1 Tax=Nocardioides cavernaquae TaxID=2321396 RepID=UPI0011C3FB6B|nr:hypothetical protein [Nocardioides cavernaquae]